MFKLYIGHRTDIPGPQPSGDRVTLVAMAIGGANRITHDPSSDGAQEIMPLRRHLQRDLERYRIGKSGCLCNGCLPSCLLLRAMHGFRTTATRARSFSTRAPEGFPLPRGLSARAHATRRREGEIHARWGHEQDAERGWRDPDDDDE